MTPSEFANELRACKAAIIASRPDDLVVVVNDAWALAKRRIRTTGTSETGSSFASYSSLYSTQRDGDGYQTEYVDYTRTGAMLNSVRARLARNTDEVGTVFLESDNELQDAKIRGHIKNRGENVIELSEEERRFAMEARERRIFKLLQQKFQ